MHLFAATVSLVALLFDSSCQAPAQSVHTYCYDGIRSLKTYSGGSFGAEFHNGSICGPSRTIQLLNQVLS